MKRILTGLIGFPIVVALLVLGNKWVIDIAFTIVAIIAMYEYMKCVSSKAKPIAWISYLCAASICLIHLIPTTLVLEFGIPVLLLVLFLHVIISNMKITFDQIAYTLWGILYIVGFIAFIPLVYGLDGDISGKILIWIVLFSAWGTDTFAYSIGKRFGKTKFSKVSPNKSIEGCIAGTLGAILMNVVFAYILNRFFGYTILYPFIILVSLVLSVIGQIGDFSASVIKRSFDIKDFSELFPGHGGMIDRIDSVMFIAPFAYLIFTLCL